MRIDPVLAVLSAASGGAALIYEIIWFQLIELIIGSSAISLGVLLATFMGGMCIGSLMLPHVVATRRHPLWVYALIELGIGLFGILILLIVPAVSGLYAANALQGIPGVLLRAAISAVLLLPPTILMGATLPAIARWMDSTSSGVSLVGALYAANIGGAMLGCILAGFYLLRVYDTATATYVAAAINATVALAAALLAAVTTHDAPFGQLRDVSSANVLGARSIYVAIALSGLTALGAEVTWTRVMALLFGASVYTFSLILAVFLLGLGIGSSAGSYLVRHVRDARTALGNCQVLLVISIAWSAYMIGSALPYWPIYPPLAPSPWFNFQIDLVSCAVAVLPAALCWGASFPFALAAVARGTDAGPATAAIYAANTIGAIIGALGFSMIVIPWLGAQRAQKLLIGLSAAAGLLMLAPSLRSARNPSPERSTKLSPPAAHTISVVAIPILAALLIASVPDVPDKLIAYGRRMLLSEGAKVLYRGDGRVSSVAVTELGEVRSFHVSGKSEASTALADMRLERMLGHLSALLHPKPRSVLVVGFGAGITAGTFVLYPEIERIVICEIEPIIPPHIGPYFTKQNYDVLHDPRVTIIYDDARHYILTTKEKFDIITSDPIHPWVKGAAMLYTQEYFELEKKHLNPGGVITQWVPLYESTTAAVKSEIATFLKVFPDGVIWSSQLRGSGSDVVLSAQATPAVVNIDAVSERLLRPEYSRVMSSLRDVKFSSATDLFATYMTQKADLAGWLSDAEINTDRNLRVQYLAGMGLNLESDRSIYEALRNSRSLPPRLFAGAQESMETLRRAIDHQSPHLRVRTHQY
jgi:spermidine synthase